MSKKSQKVLQPKGKAEQSLSEDAANALEKSLRMAAGGVSGKSRIRADDVAYEWTTRHQEAFGCHRRPVFTKE